MPQKGLQNIIQTYNEIKTEIKMSRATVFFVVEGLFDKKFFLSFLNEKNVTIFIMYGKENLDKIVEDEDLNTRIVFGFRDRDYDYFDNTHVSPNITLSNNRDLIIDILSTNTVRDKIIRYYLNSTRNDITEVLFGYAEYLGYIRYANDLYSLGLCFDCFKKYIKGEETSGKLWRYYEDNNRLINYVLQQNHHKYKVEEIVCKIETLQETRYYTKQICNGHDVLTILCHILKRDFHKRYISYEEVETFICGCYEKEDFVASDMYSCIKRWEEESEKVLLKEFQ